jgi:hypothetical protein
MAGIFWSYLTLLQKSSQNIEDVEKLTQQIEGLTAFLEKSKSGGVFPQVVIDRIGRLSRYVAIIASQQSVDLTFAPTVR